MPIRCLLTLLLLLPLAVDAQVVYRCKDAGGASVFADRPCHSMQATPVAPPQIVGEQGSSAHAMAWRRSARSQASADGIPEAAFGCPGRDPVTLRERMHRALHLRDINALAALYDWTGHSHQQARGTLRDLQALIDSRPSALRLESATNLSLDSAPGDWLPRLQVYRDDDALYPQASYRLVRNAGCVWLAG